ncbi:MAG: tyrosine phosphatase family protein [Rhizobiaceae bacterium]|nr:tyrosine phosphatase family protein [Rhizobiaceae bacterium]
MIVVCPLSKLEATVADVRPDRLISVLSEGTELVRPAAIDAANHLHITMHDISEEREGMTLPGEEHVRRILDFARAWDRRRPLVVHCYAGISRSTATAYMVAAAFAPGRSEAELARTLRRLSPSATPNQRMIALADHILRREGRMVSAIQGIGRGAEAFEGTPFTLEI